MPEGDTLEDIGPEEEGDEEEEDAACPGPADIFRARTEELGGGTYERD